MSQLGAKRLSKTFAHITVPYVLYFNMMKYQTSLHLHFFPVHLIFRSNRFTKLLLILLLLLEKHYMAT